MTAVQGCSSAGYDEPHAPLAWRPDAKRAAVAERLALSGGRLGRSRGVRAGGLSHVCRRATPPACYFFRVSPAGREGRGPTAAPVALLGRVRPVGRSFESAALYYTDKQCARVVPSVYSVSNTRTQRPTLSPPPPPTKSPVAPHHRPPPPAFALERAPRSRGHARGGPTLPPLGRGGGDAFEERSKEQTRRKKKKTTGKRLRSLGPVRPPKTSQRAVFPPQAARAARGLAASAAHTALPAQRAGRSGSARRKTSRQRETTVTFFWRQVCSGPP